MRARIFVSEVLIAFALFVIASLMARAQGVVMAGDLLESVADRVSYVYSGSGRLLTTGPADSRTIDLHLDVMVLDTVSDILTLHGCIEQRRSNGPPLPLSNGQLLVGVPLRERDGFVVQLRIRNRFMADENGRFIATIPIDDPDLAIVFTGPEIPGVERMEGMTTIYRVGELMRPR